MNLPPRVYLTRKDVLTALGGRKQLEKAEAGGHLRRVPLAGYKIAHYTRADVARYLTEVGGFTGPLDGASAALKTATP